MATTQTNSAESDQKKHAFSRLLLPVLFYRVYLLLFVYLAVQLLPPIFHTEIYYEIVHWPADEPPSLITAYKTWDGHHYLYLSDHGYQPGTVSNAFYPLWPLLIRLGSYLFLGNHLVSALVLSNLFSVVGLLLFHYFVWNYHGEEVADLATWILLAYPGALFFAFPYTESLFLLLAVLFFVVLYRRDYLAAALVSFFLPLTRSVGVFVGVPFFLDIYRSWKERRKMQLSDLAYLIAPVLGMLMYFLLMYVSTGNPWEGIDAQKLFPGQRSLSKLFDLPALVRSFAQMGSWHEPLDSFFDRVWFVVFLLCLSEIWKIDRRYFWVSVLMGVFPVMTGTFWSFTRFLAVIFPVFIAMADVLSRDRWKAYRWTVISIMFSLQIVFLIRHINNYWAG
jgi:hypothetical protein